MHELLADNWDIQALVSSAVCSLPYFSSPCIFTINNNTYFNNDSINIMIASLCMQMTLLVAIVYPQNSGSMDLQQISFMEK